MSLRARVGRFAVIQIDMDEYSYMCTLKDFGNADEAIELADKMNMGRKRKKDDAYQVIDDTGRILRGPENVRNLNVV